MVADSHSIVARWRKYFSQLFNKHGFKDVGQAEIHTAEPLVPEPSASEFELAIDKLKSHKSPGIDQIPAEEIKAGGREICLEIHKLISSIWKMKKWTEEWKESIKVPIPKKGDKTDFNNYRGISHLPTTYFIFSKIPLSRSIPYAKEIIGDHQCGFRRNRPTIDRIFCIRQTTLTNQSSIREEIKKRMRSGNACYHSVQNFLASRLLFKNLKISVYIEL